MVYALVRFVISIAIAIYAFTHGAPVIGAVIAVLGIVMAIYRIRRAG